MAHVHGLSDERYRIAPGALGGAPDFWSTFDDDVPHLSPRREAPSSAAAPASVPPSFPLSFPGPIMRSVLRGARFFVHVCL